MRFFTPQFVPERKQIAFTEMRNNAASNLNIDVILSMIREIICGKGITHETNTIADSAQTISQFKPSGSAFSFFCFLKYKFCAVFRS